jgi:hypothetical protein
MKLYHYTKFEIAATKILPFKKLRFNSFEKVNDPLENLLHLTKYEDAIFMNENISDFLKARHFQKEWQVLSFSIDKKGDDEVAEGYKLHRMWAQYGENNVGICLEIDYEKFVTENQKIIERYHFVDAIVEYNNYALRAMPMSLIGKKHNPDVQPPFVNTYDVSPRALNKTEIKDRFFTKNTDWRSEVEYRFIAYSENNDELFFSIKDSLEKVYLGVGFSKHYVPSISKSVPLAMVCCMTLDIYGNYEAKDLPVT